MKRKILLIPLLIFICAILISTSSAQVSVELVWLIEPEFKHENIYYCAFCNLLGDIDILDISDIETIIETYDYNTHNNINIIYICSGHGFYTAEYYLDEEKNIIVVHGGSEGGSELNYYTFDEYDELLGNYWSNQLVAFRKIDSEKIELDEYGGFKDAYDGYGNYDTPSYVGGQYALVRGTTFITDFIYDDYKSRGNRHRSDNLIDFKLNGKWGIVNKNGKTVIPFIFEDIEFIDDNYAFAKYNDKYGILDLKNTMLTTSSPATSDNTVYIFIVLFISAILVIKSYHLAIPNKHFLR